ncbi:hypothetical protein [Mycobacterium sp. E2479]|uniref:hypothetical protein n=1 Tax=Mycobacterium sp. E2479 TaxID=1834134 RepID=UPI000802549C|nr:hypothetical protein [Mycobacterium sp. E2479]OBH53559.1 hypothetical protein A5686_09035 [Mycobacterium sp. E2479]
MLTERLLVMTHNGTGAGAVPDGSMVQAAALVDEGSALSVLIAEVDAILCDAAASLLCPPPSPPVAGCALAGPRTSGRFRVISGRPWTAPAPDVRAVQRSPP